MLYFCKGKQTIEYKFSELILKVININMYKPWNV